MCRGITERGYGMFIDMDEHIPRIQAILAAARAAGAPVVFTTVAYHPDLADAGMFGRKARLVRDLVHGSERVEIDLRLPWRTPTTCSARRCRARSHGTHLHAMLTGLGVDTTIVVGNSTSGCVRATACDAISNGFPAHRSQGLRGRPRAALARGESSSTSTPSTPMWWTSDEVLAWLARVAGPVRARAVG